MADNTIRLPEAPAGWHDAFAALPLEDAPAAGWTAVSRRLDARRRFMQRALPLAAAAMLALAIVPAWLSRTFDTPSPTQGPPATVAQGGRDARITAAALPQLQAESARLETLLQYARDSRVASGAAAVMATEFDARVAAVDAALMQPDLDPAQRTQLWQARVEVLRAFAGFESTRRWLAAGGERYDGALVRVD